MSLIERIKNENIKPVLYRGLENERYHAHGSVSKSQLDLVSKCPALFKWVVLDGNKREQTPAMELGQAVHMAVLEPEKFSKNFVTLPKELFEHPNKRTKEYRDLKTDFEKTVGEKKVLDQSAWETVASIRDAVMSNKMASSLLNNGEPELSVFWEDEKTKMPLRCRPDWLRADGIVVDLKTTTDATLRAFEASSVRFRYHVQAALYLDGIERVLGHKVKQFIFVVCETKPPWHVALYEVAGPVIELGRELYRRDLATLVRCIETKEWPGLNDDKILQMGLPAWAWNLEE